MFPVNTQQHEDARIQRMRKIYPDLFDRAGVGSFLVFIFAIFLILQMYRLNSIVMDTNGQSRWMEKANQSRQVRKGLCI